MSTTTSAPAGSPPRQRPPRPVAVLASTAVVAALAAAALVLSAPYPFSNADGSIGPGAMPRVVSGALLLVCLGRLAALELTHRRTAAPAVVATTSDGEGATGDGAQEVPGAHRKLLRVGATVLVTALAIPFAGLLLSLTAMTFFLAAVVEKQPVVRSAVVAGATFVVTYLVFGVLLRVPLPLGVFDPALWRS
ncbi:tripartite tricarboxylate transporter TctB family protein [Kineococcus terrestris]|uniref:tripartite tricarboxylate transporter TctB family protein n=1 Tax=Kineococcus terrestris TaxID=2044856 RepID=UPI0034DB1E41